MELKTVPPFSYLIREKERNVPFFPKPISIESCEFKVFKPSIISETISKLKSLSALYFCLTFKTGWDCEARIEDKRHNKPTKGSNKATKKEINLHGSLSKTKRFLHK